MRQKPIIGIIASHDDEGRNRALATVLDYVASQHTSKIEAFQIAMTRGTYRRVIKGENDWDVCVSDETRDILTKSGILRLPCREHGGVVLLANMVVKRQINVVWPFLTPTTTHWLNPENLALLRLCDHWHVTSLMNEVSVAVWMQTGVNIEGLRNGQPVPPELTAGGTAPSKALKIPIQKQEDGTWAIEWATWRANRMAHAENTVALVAHNEMKDRIRDFVLDYERELSQFDRIITTGTTGGAVIEVAPELGPKVRRYRSGPKGGDIEIATEMIFKRCNAAVFLVDPLSPHPHIEDVRVLFGAAILNRVQLLKNERQARSWMDVAGDKERAVQDFLRWSRERE